jgi:Xaa-Pro aminopeptidase
MFRERVERTRQRMGELDVDVLLMSVGADLPWLTGYTAMPLERLTMLVLRRDGDAALVVPRLEAPRVAEHPELFSIVRGRRPTTRSRSSPSWPERHVLPRSVIARGRDSSSISKPGCQRPPSARAAR